MRVDTSAAQSLVSQYLPPCSHLAQDARPKHLGGDGPLGLLAPTWLSASDGSPLPRQPGTRLVLPLASPGSPAPGIVELVPPSRLADALVELPRRPELLLFLRRVRSLVVQLSSGTGGSGTDGELEVRVRRVPDEAVVLLPSLNLSGHAAALGTVLVSGTVPVANTIEPQVFQRHRWILHHATTSLAAAPAGVIPPAALASAGMSTTLTLAFALDDTLDASPALLYAFLPVARFGLRFALNADWMLSTTREALLAGHSWNRWIAHTLLPAAFIAARETFIAAAMSGALSDTSSASKDNGSIHADTDRSIEHVASLAWLRALPIAAELRSQHDGGLFATAAGAISTALQDVDCLPLLGGGWVSPARAITVSGPAMSARSSTSRVFGTASRSRCYT